MKYVVALLCVVLLAACAESLPEPITGRTAMTLPNGHYGWSVWCRGGQARCWWEASRFCGTDGYRVYDESNNAWTETQGRWAYRSGGYVQQTRHSNGSILIECGPFTFAKPIVPATTASAAPTAPVPVQNDTGRDFVRGNPF